MIDSPFHLLLPELQSVTQATLWLADESALPVLATLTNTDQPLHIATNRYDIYLLAKEKQFSCHFNDFELEQLPFIPQVIIYRISKEKVLCHYLLEWASRLLPQEGKFIISGKKQEGIKSYSDKLIKLLGARGKLKKMGTDYKGSFTFPNHSGSLPDSQHYLQLQALTFEGQNQAITTYTKPGVFGWNKVDTGTELLLQQLPHILKQQPPARNILDLGCGYGWIFLNLPSYLPPKWLQAPLQLVATDNNASALICAKKNSEQCEYSVHVVPSDAGNTIDDVFDLILCNPPFHQGFHHDKSLTVKFLQQTLQHLTPTGIAVFVVNEFIQLPASILSNNPRVECLEYCRSQGYKLITLTQHGKSKNC